jgi:hypothetical protein
MKRMLIQLQLSNYDTKGKFILECDSNWQIWAHRSREMLKLNPELEIDMLCPLLSGPNRQVLTHPKEFCPEIFETGRLRLLQTQLIANAPSTRYDFDMRELGTLLGGRHYDAVFVNDPALLPNYKALFFLHGMNKHPKFFLQIHFVDHPPGSGREKFPAEVSLWDRQVEALRKADINFWMCEPTAQIVLQDVRRDYRDNVFYNIQNHSHIWDDGYSQTETSQPPDLTKVRFNINLFKELTKDKIVIFVPNRVGGRGRTSDYTHNGEFLFEKLPELRKLRQDFVVIAGNPSQKFSNIELQGECGPYGLITLVPNSLNRDEYRFVAGHSHISVHLYDTEHHGGIASRECVEMGCSPLWTDCNEYHNMAEAGGYAIGMCSPDRSDLVIVMGDLLDWIREEPAAAQAAQRRLRAAVRERCAYERTTEPAMKLMGLL